MCLALISIVVDGTAPDLADTLKVTRRSAGRLSTLALLVGAQGVIGFEPRVHPRPRLGPIHIKEVEAAYRIQPCLYSTAAGPN